MERLLSISFTLEQGEEDKARSLFITKDNDPSTSISFGISTYQKFKLSEEKFAASQQKKIAELEQKYVEAVEGGLTEKVKQLTEDIITKTDASDSVKFLDTVERFLEISLPEDGRQNALYEYYKNCHEVIMGMDTGNIDISKKKLRNLTRGIFAEIDLPAAAQDFVDRAHLPMPNTENAGTQDHDTPEMTFGRADIRQITALVIICKLMCPVWGHLCYGLGMLNMQAIHNDLHCLSIVEAAFRDSILSDIYDKLYEYSVVFTTKLMYENAHQINGSNDKKTNYENNMFVISNSGYGLERFRMLMFGSVLVRRAVAFDLWKSSLVGEDRNAHFIVTACSRLRNTVSHALRRMTDVSNKVPRYDLNSNASVHNEESNITQLENQSPASKITMDIPILIREGVKIAIDRGLDEEDLNREEFDKLVRFYTKNPIVPNFFNMAVVSIVLISPLIGVSRNIEFLNAEEFTRACVYVMLKLIKNNHQFDIIAAMIPSETIESINPTILMASSLRRTYNQSAIYQQTLKNFPLVCLAVEQQSVFSTKNKKRSRRLGERQTIGTQLTRTLEWVTLNDHHVLLPEFMWRRLSSLPRQSRGEPLVYDDTFMDKFCEVILEYSLSA